MNTWRQISTHGYLIVCAEMGCRNVSVTVVGREELDWWRESCRRFPLPCNECTGRLRFEWSPR